MQSPVSIDTPEEASITPVGVRRHPQRSIDVRSASLAVIAVLAAIYALHWAGAVVIPVLLGLMCSYALTPLVDRLQAWHIPRALSAATLMLAIAGGAASTVYALGDDATAMIESLPEAAQKLQRALRSTRGEPESPIAKVQRAAAKLEQAAEVTAAVTPPAPATSKGVARVQVEPPRFSIKTHLWNGTLGLVGLLGQALVVLFITFFLLVSGDTFRRKMVRIAGPRLSQKKITVQVLDEINLQIQRYLQVQIFTSVLVGALTWLALLGFGMEHAAVWGIVAALLNLVPYVGSLVTAGALALAGFLQFGTLGMALAIGGVSLAINTLEGNLLTPWLTGRAARMSPLVIFIGVLAFGWLWGLWGLLLGAPLLMAAKVVCDHVDGLKPVGELLGA
jgi:predicted PurR-regulated permease PerM